MQVQLPPVSNPTHSTCCWSMHTCQSSVALPLCWTFIGRPDMSCCWLTMSQADLAQQIKSRQAAAVGAKTAAPDAGQEAPLLAGSLDSAGSIAKRHQQQVLYR